MVSSAEMYKNIRNGYAGVEIEQKEETKGKNQPPEPKMVRSTLCTLKFHKSDN